MKVRAYDIVWDTDGLKASHLPTDVTIDMDLDSDPYLETADALSDHYGFCVQSLKVRVEE
jgi:hypothetical protein